MVGAVVSPISSSPQIAYMRAPDVYEYMTQLSKLIIITESTTKSVEFTADVFVLLLSNSYGSAL